MKEFLRSTAIIDWDRSEIRELALGFPGGSATDVARRCFEWVRDEIAHSFDAAATCVTTTASEALKHRTGICFTKSHLLAALLRANSIPAGFGYQRIALDVTGEAYCLHGFNFVFLDQIGWYAIDPRGDREGISTTFDPPNVSLAFPIRLPGEKTFNTVFPDPLPSVLESLEGSDTVAELRENLPDRTKINEGPVVADSQGRLL